MKLRKHNRKNIIISRWAAPGVLSELGAERVNLPGAR